jgi:hypothetical protein
MKIFAFAVKLALLLNGENPMAQQCMGIAFPPPLPALCPPISLDGYGFFIPKFKASAASKFGILDFRTMAMKGGVLGDQVDGMDWLVPAGFAL